MVNKVFNVPIFFIIFRETIEAAIIVSVLLSFVEQLMTTGRLAPKETLDEATVNDDYHNQRVAKIVKRMRWQIWAGTLVGFFIALCIGAAFIAVFYTKLNDLWAKTETLWEGIFSLIASIIIYIMGIAFLKMDHSRVKWRYKLAAAFERDSKRMLASRGDGELAAEDKAEGKGSKWALFLLPLITLLREGLEAIVFVGGVSLGIPATSIPLPVVVGLIAGFIIGYLIYRTGSSTTLHWFLVISTTFLFLIGAGLFAKSIGFFEYYRFASKVGGDVAESGDGPGSWDVVHDPLWHLTYGNPEPGSPSTNGGWQIFNAIFGWNNTASIGTVVGYVMYWVVIMVTLVFHKWREGRFTFFGKHKSAAAQRLDTMRADKASRGHYGAEPTREAKVSDNGSATEGTEGSIAETPMTEKRVPQI